MYKKAPAVQGSHIIFLVVGRNKGGGGGKPPEAPIKDPFVPPKEKIRKGIYHIFRPSA